MRNRNDVLSTIHDTIKEAGDCLIEMFNNVTISQKEVDYNTVTDADLASERIITNAIRQKYPHDIVLGEEANQEVELLADHLWIIDPLDGTNNYASGMPHFSISIAYCEKGRPVVGAIYDPFRNELFWAIEGQGAFLNHTPITVSARTKLSESLIATGFYYDRGTLMEKTLASMKDLFHHGIRGIRRAGSAALDLAWTAAGRYGGFYEYQLSVWDFAAGVLIVKEAGGTTTDIDGSDFSLGNRGIITGSESMFDELLSVVKWDSEKAAE